MKQIDQVAGEEDSRRVDSKGGPSRGTVGGLQTFTEYKEKTKLDPKTV